MNKQLKEYKKMIIAHLRTSQEAPWHSSQYIQLQGISDFLKRTEVMTEEEEDAIIKEARASIHNPENLIENV
jgi:hypothetical protein